MAKEKEILYRKLYRPHLKEIKGLTSLLNKLKSLKIKCAVATTAPLENRRFILNQLSLTPDFDLVLGEEGVDHGKPNPDIYLKAAEKLKVKPTRCIVFEDSLAGIEAARKAGAFVVALLTSHKKEDLKSADVWIKEFSEIRLLR